jgi:hypothetical protein
VGDMGESSEEVHDINIIMKKKEGIFYLAAPELGLLVKGNDISKLYQEISDQKKAILREYSDLGIVSQIQLPSIPDKETTLVEMSKFVFKSALLSSIVILLFFVTISFTFNKAINIFSSPQIIHVGSRIIDKLENMPPEKKEQYLRWVRKVVVSLKPFLDELKPLSSIPFENNSNSELKPVFK